MFGIYKYENGLQFTGKIANTEKEAETYLANKYGKMELVYSGKHNENNVPLYEEVFIPWYNKESFCIKELELVG